MIVGITGKYCAGKNVVGKILASHGYEVIDVDKLGHPVVEERKTEIVERFGAAVLGEDGQIDRRALGKRVFRDRRALDDLEHIVHPAMIAEVERRVGANTGRKVAINAAILFHMKLHRSCDAVLWVTAPFAMRVVRALRRDHLPLLQVAGRLWAQRKLSPQPFMNSVDIYIVKNSGSERALESSICDVVLTG
jgi:dephospho-CoA kinase